MAEGQWQLLALHRILHHPALRAKEKGARLLTLPEVLERAIAHEHARGIQMDSGIRAAPPGG